MSANFRRCRRVLSNSNSNSNPIPQPSNSPLNYWQASQADEDGEPDFFQQDGGQLDEDGEPDFFQQDGGQVDEDGEPDEDGEDGGEKKEPVLTEKRTFWILQQSEHLFNNYQNKIESVKNNVKENNKKIFLENPNIKTYQVASKISDWVRSNKISSKAVDALFKVLGQDFGIKNLPCSKTFTSTISQLVADPVAETYLVVDHCVNGCAVYVGDNSTMLNCPVDACGEARFHPCADCTRDSKIQCTCKISERLAIKSFVYFPIINWLKEVLFSDKAHMFLLAVNYELMNPARPGAIYDISQGALAVEELEIMRKNASETFPGKEPISLMLHLFYDGIQMFKNAVTPNHIGSWSITNMAPTFRHFNGVGQMPLALFNSDQKNEAERHLFGDCVSGELLKLAQGVVIGKFVVQARVLAIICDTKGHEPLTNCQSAGSNAPCPQCGFRGHTKFGRRVYEGHRVFLPLTHLFRAIGQSLQCCHQDTYSNNPEVRKNRLQIELETQKHTSRLKKVRIVNSSGIFQEDGDEDGETRQLNEVTRLWFETGHFCCTPNEKQELKSFYQSNRPFFWYHQFPFSPKDFQKSVYFQNLDYRTMQQHRSTTKEQHFERMDEADRRGTVYEGNHGSWMLRPVSYMGPERCIWDAFHAIPNVFKLVIGLMKDERGDGSKSSHKLHEYCTVFGMHPCLQSPKPNHQSVPVSRPWVLSESQRCRMDAFVNSAIVSCGYGNSYQLKFPFAVTGKVSSAGAISFLITLLPTIVSLLANDDVDPIPWAYAQYYKMLSQDLCELLAPFFFDEDLSNLRMKIIETVVTFEGLFPPTEVTHGLHQLVDLPNQLKMHGPLRSSMSHSHETFCGAMKRANPKSGQSSQKTMVRKSQAKYMLNNDYAYDRSRVGKTASWVVKTRNGVVKRR